MPNAQRHDASIVRSSSPAGLPFIVNRFKTGKNPPPAYTPRARMGKPSCMSTGFVRKNFSMLRCPCCFMLAVRT